MPLARSLAYTMNAFSHRPFWILLAATGCTPAIQSMSFLSPPPAPRPETQPVPFYSEIRPECPYEEIGTVSSRKRNSFVSMEKVAEGIRKGARKLGGDAVIGVNQRLDPIADANNSPIFTGTVIRFKNPDCTR